MFMEIVTFLISFLVISAGVGVIEATADTHAGNSTINKIVGNNTKIVKPVVKTVAKVNKTVNPPVPKKEEIIEDTVITNMVSEDEYVKKQDEQIIKEHNKDDNKTEIEAEPVMTIENDSEKLENNSKNITEKKEIKLPTKLIKSVDSDGNIVLGKEYSGKKYILTEVKDGQ